jgi:hypothetical protein
MKPKLKAPRTKRLTLKFKNLLSNFAFNFNLRRYNLFHLALERHRTECAAAAAAAAAAGGIAVLGGDRQGLTLVPNSAQLELFRPPYDPT